MTRDEGAPRIPLGFGGLFAAPGDHIGHFYESAEEWRSLAVGFLKQGLEANDRCVYIVDQEAQPELREALLMADIDVDRALERGTLTFDPGRNCADSMRELLGNALAEVHGRHSLLRWGGHMTWSCSAMPTSEALMEWESCCNEVDNAPAVFLCHYELAAFRGDILMDALRTHPICVVGDAIHSNPFYEPPEVFLDGLRQRRGISFASQ